MVVAYVASVSSRVVRAEAKGKNKMEGGGGGGKKKRLPVNPTILENAPWYFTTARQGR